MLSRRLICSIYYDLEQLLLRRDFLLWSAMVVLRNIDSVFVMIKRKLVLISYTKYILIEAANLVSRIHAVNKSVFLFN